MWRRVGVGLLVILAVLIAVWGPVRGPESETAPAPPTHTLTSGECAAAPPARLAPGMSAIVVRPARGQVRRNLVVRDAPGGDQVGVMSPGTRFSITGDALCAGDGLRWWPVATARLSGWSVEGFAPDDYLMQPVGSG